LPHWVTGQFLCWGTQWKMISFPSVIWTVIALHFRMTYSSNTLNSRRQTPAASLWFNIYGRWS
jgi:hypothetical protein